MRGLVLVFLLFGLPVAAQADTLAGPSFNCVVAKGAVEQMICHDLKLAAADRELANDYMNTANQGGIDPKALRREEDAWLLQRDACRTDDCIAAAYAARKAAILDESLRAASPAAYEETKAYATPAEVLATAQAKIGQGCDAVGFGAAPKPPFAAIAGFLVISGPGFYIVPVQISGSRFAYLLKSAGSMCMVADVVALPAQVVADRFLECFPDNADALGLNGAGVGMRKAGVAGNVAYWNPDVAAGRLEREPLGVLGIDKAGLRCQQPETGE